MSEVNMIKGLSGQCPDLIYFLQPHGERMTKKTGARHTCALVELNRGAQVQSQDTVYPIRQILTISQQLPEEFKSRLCHAPLRTREM